jgi:hypothetical protein
MGAGAAIGRTLDKIFDTASGARRFLGDVFKDTTSVADDVLNVATRVKPLFIKPADNALGFAYRRWVTPTVLGGAFAVGLATGPVRASVGLVNVGDVESLTGETRTPNLQKKQIQTGGFLDHLGADGELALALHALRNG